MEKGETVCGNVNWWGHYGEEYIVIVQSLGCVCLCHPMNCSTTGCPLLSPWDCLNSCSLSQWCHPTSSSSVNPFSSCPQPLSHQGLFQLLGSLHQVAKVLELQLQDQSFQWIFRVDFLLEWLVGPPCCPVDSQESSPALKFERINSSALSLFYGPILTSVHDYQKNHSFDYTNLCPKSNVSAF